MILVLLFVLSNANGEEVSKEKKEPKFSLQTTDKVLEVKEIKNGLAFKGYEDKIVMLSFVAYNGNPCLRELAAFNKIKKEHKEIKIVAIEVRGLAQDALKKFAKEKEFDFPFITYNDAKEFTNYISTRAGWRGSLPFTLIMDKKGVVKYLQEGLISFEELEKIYQKIK
jgi:peroxiredoxin